MSKAPRPESPTDFSIMNSVHTATRQADRKRRLATAEGTKTASYPLSTKVDSYKLSGKSLEDALAEHTRKMREKRTAKSKKPKSRKPKGASKVARARPHPHKGPGAPLI
jgi:hypothetical protein